MIDTVVLIFRIMLEQATLNMFWDGNLTHKVTGNFTLKYILNRKCANGSVVKCTFFPYSFTGYPLLQIEFSIPKLIFGNNINMIKDVRDLIPEINECLTHINGLPSLKVEDGQISRIDLCYNHQVGDTVPFFIKSLGALEFPYRKTIIYENTEVAFKNDSGMSKFYDKYQESNDQKAFGILRQETTIRKKSTLQKLTGKKNPTLMDFTPEIIKTALDSDLKDLDIYDRSIGNMDTTLNKLVELEGEYAGIYYYGLLFARYYLPMNGISCLESEQKRINHSRSMNRRLQRIVDHGMPPTITESKEPLPVLTIDLDDSHFIDVEKQVSKITKWYSNEI